MSAARQLDFMLAYDLTVPTRYSEGLKWITKSAIWGDPYARI